MLVALVGVVATTATSEAETSSSASDETTLELVLDATRAVIAFDVTTTVRATDPLAAELRADLRVDDDGDAATDGVHLLDVGLLPEGQGLPDDVDVAGDASMASVGEGAFGIGTDLAIDDVEGGVVTTLVVRLRPEARRARVNVRLTATATVADTATPSVDVDVAPRADEPPAPTGTP